jgi:outer membrane protein assembly factor BamB
MIMIQRKTTRNRWKAGALAATLIVSGAVGVIAAQQPPVKAAPVQQPPVKVAPAQPPPIVQMRFQVGGGVVQARGGAIIMGGPPGVVQGTGEGGANERVKLPVDPRARRKLDDAKRFIDLPQPDWQSAVQILQSLLDANEDNFLQESDGEKGRRVSVRAEANRILGSLPREGKQFYEQQFGAIAKQALKQAKSQSNPQALAEIALRYVHTDAGAEAAALLGSYHLDHGRYIVAALCFERLLSREGTQLPAATLYKAAVAFERSGDKANRDKAWGLFQARLAQPNSKLPPAIRSWDEGKLQGALGANLQERSDGGQSDWPMFMGSPDRTARSNGTAPFLEQRLPAYEPVTSAQATQARRDIEEASKKLRNLGVPVIPGSHPLVIRNLVLFRALDGLHAFDLKSGQMAWYSSSDASLANMASSSSVSDHDGYNNPLSYRDVAPVILTENTLLGTLSADQELVYAVEDLALPRMSYGGGMGMRWNNRGDNMQQLGNKLRDYSDCNHLTAYDIEGGRAVWSIGTRIPDQPFSDMYFLGPPLPIGEKLYVLGESHGEIKLLCLQNRRAHKPGQQGEYQYSVELNWAQPLGIVSQQPITEDPVRRSQAALLSYSDGILVCPTNAGSVIGVDLLTRSLVWAYNYQTESSPMANDEQFMMMQMRRGRMPAFGDSPASASTTQWSFSAPVISNGKVFLAPPDGKALHAINLRDGSQAWTVNRVDTGKDAAPPDQYLAGVFDGKVILVGRQAIRALNVDNGKELWRTPTGVPTGRGVAAGPTYYLPLRNNDLMTINLADGKVMARAKALQKEQLGNLVLVGEDLVSLNHTHLLVYPVMAVKERQIAQRLAKNPKDPVGLLERGEMRWHREGLEPAVADFELALANDPPPFLKTKAESKLVEALLILLDQEFAKYETKLDRLKELALRDVPANAKAEEKETQQDRKSRYLRVVAQGRERQGRVADALDAYSQFAKLDSKLIASPDDPQGKVLPVVWARGRAEAMAGRVTADGTKQLTAAVQAALDKARAANTPEAMKEFIQLYGGIGVTGQHALLEYAEMLLDRRDYTAAQVRVLPLLRVNEPTVAARAMDLLARLNVRSGELENAAYYYLLLAKKYPTVPVRDGKTGAKLFQELMNDKRFLPYLDPKRGLSELRDVSVEKLSSTTPSSSGRDRFGGSYVVQLNPTGPVEPSMARFEVFVHVDLQGSNTSRYVIADRETQKEVFSKTSNTMMVPNYGSQTKHWPTYQVCGPAIVFTWANRLIAVDPVQKKELWSVHLLDPNDQNYARSYNTMPHPEMPGRLLVMQAGAWEAIGSVGPGSSRRIVATLRDEGLVAFDPVTGERVWSRSGVSTNTELFGDEEVVLVVPSKKVDEQLSAFRLEDGKDVPVSATMAMKYRERVAMVGRCILTKSPAPQGGDVLMLIDPLGEAVKWQTPLPQDAIVLKDGEGADYTGYVVADGTVHVFDVTNGKELHKVKLAPIDGIDKYAAHVLMDEQQGYVLLSKGFTDNDKDGNEMRMYPQYQSIRSVPVNGPAVAFERRTGKVLWQETLPLQYLIARRFDEMPVLLCSAMIDRSKVNPNALPGRPAGVVVGRRTGRIEHEVCVFSKQTGKVITIEDKPSRSEFGLERQGYGGYHAVVIDPPAGTIGLKSQYRTLTVSLKSKAVASR